MNIETVKNIIKSEAEISLFDLPNRAGKKISEHIQRPFAALRQEQRKQLVHALYYSGILQYKGSIETFAFHLSVSRTTLYNYANMVVNETVSGDEQCMISQTS